MKGTLHDILVQSDTLLLLLFLVFILSTITGCMQPIDDTQKPIVEGQIPTTKGETLEESDDIIVSQGSTIGTRFNPPKGYERMPQGEDSFGAFLQNLPLKAYGEKVYYYDGREKNNEVHASVIDIDTGDRDLQQCADAVMRLRAEYLYHLKQYDQIHFNFTNGFNAEYSRWIAGDRISVEGNEVKWVSSSDYDESYDTFRKYMNMVFAYAGTLSLEQELVKVDSLDEIEVGDIFIQGGSPGHAVIVVDVAIEPNTNEKLFLLAQSYMPAQDMHILINPNDQYLSPWYSNGFETLTTPEWRFDKENHMRF